MEVSIKPALPDDVPAIVGLQGISYQKEGILYDDLSILPLSKR